jgi:hypothetical protein
MAAQGTENKGVELTESAGQLEWARNAKKIRDLEPGEGVLLDGFVVGVRGGFEEEDGGDEDEDGGIGVFPEGEYVLISSVVFAGAS